MFRLQNFQIQNRGGRGVAGMTQKDNDFTEELFVGSTHDYMLFMTDKGRVYRLKGYQVAEGSRTAKGSHIANLLQLQEGASPFLQAPLWPAPSRTLSGC